MTRDQALEYIRIRIRELAARKYPNDPHRQLIYTVGFLESFLSDLMQQDSVNYIKFKKTIDKGRL